LWSPQSTHRIEGTGSSRETAASAAVGRAGVAALLRVADAVAALGRTVDLGNVLSLHLVESRTSADDIEYDQTYSYDWW